MALTEADTMPGTLTTADMAILGSTLAWTRHESDTGRIAWQSGRYRILSDGDNPRYWTATVRLDRDRVHLGAGAGDLGLAKCVRLCERHAQTAQRDNVSHEATRSDQAATQTSTETDVVRNRAVCGPVATANNDLSPQQQQLL